MSNVGTAPREKRLALFIDYDNLAVGMKNSSHKRFQIDLILDRVLEKGKILVKRAYADWSAYREGKSELHEAAVELVEIPRKRVGGKNSADIRMVVDALDLAFSRTYIDSFVLVTGDSDFSPLVTKLREHDREVIGIGMKAATSRLLIENCDEFIFYEDLLRRTASEVSMKGRSDLSKPQKEAFDLVVDVARALLREGRDTVWAGMIKQTIRRKNPSFDESYHDYGSFSELLLDMEAKGILELQKDNKSGSLVVTGVIAR
ncbi:MAG: NYN domain-containing protein [Planctomycetes bacterium]|nr:NYN domain-containing protein [Planctomycetota bacterium]